MSNEVFSVVEDSDPSGMAYFTERSENGDAFFIQNIFIDEFDPEYTDSATSGCKDSG